MNDIKDMLKKLPDMEHSFSIETKGNVTGLMYAGSFRCRIPTNKQKVLAERKRAELTGGMDPSMDMSVVQFAYKIAYLRATVIDAPKWWVDADFGFDLHDPSVIDEVYEKVAEFEKNWMDKVWGKKEQDGAAKA